MNVYLQVPNYYSVTNHKICIFVLSIIIIRNIVREEQEPVQKFTLPDLLQPIIELFGFLAKTPRRQGFSLRLCVKFFSVSVRV
jgi:hypothetical protein